MTINPLYVEIFGTFVAILVLVSYVFTDQAKLRTFNILASIGFVIYGLLLAAISNWINGWATIGLNICCIVTHIVWVVKDVKYKASASSELAFAEFRDKTSKASLCFDCAFGYSNKCIHMFDHSCCYVGTKLEEGVVVDCPRFCPAAVKVSAIAKILGCSTDKVYRTKPENLVQLLAEKGYKIKVTGINGEYTYRVKETPKMKENMYSMKYIKEVLSPPEEAQ